LQKQRRAEKMEELSSAPSSTESEWQSSLPNSVHELQSLNLNDTGIGVNARGCENVTGGCENVTGGCENVTGGCENVTGVSLVNSDHSSLATSKTQPYVKGPIQLDDCTSAVTPESSPYTPGKTHPRTNNNEERGCAIGSAAGDLLAASARVGGLFRSSGEGSAQGGAWWPPS
jgi:hypothetical protein